MSAGVENGPDFAFLFIDRNKAKDWAAEHESDPLAERFAEAWTLCRKLVEQDSSVVDQVFALERERKRPNSVRRFMPTLAGFLHIDPQQAQAVGFWQDIPKGQAHTQQRGLEALRASFPMSDRYSGVRVQVSGRGQLACLAIPFEMLRRAQRDVGLQPPKLRRHDLFTWSSLEKYRLAPDEVEALLRSKSGLEPGGQTTHFDLSGLAHLLEPGTNKPGATHRRADPVRQHFHARPAPVRGLGPAAFQDSASSASSDSSTSSKATTNASSQCEITSMKWFVLSRSRTLHLVQEGTDDDQCIPLCRSTPFTARISEQGVDPTSQIYDMCAACVRSALVKDQLGPSPSVQDPASDS